MKNLSPFEVRSPNRVRIPKFLDSSRVTGWAQPVGPVHQPVGPVGANRSPEPFVLIYLLLHF